MTITIEHNRKAYMTREVDHQTYYAQFVTEKVTRLVIAAIGPEAIKGSTDPHFNDIPLPRWDALAQGNDRFLADEWAAVATSNSSTYRDGARVISLSDKVCVLKAAARQIRGW